MPRAETQGLHYDGALSVASGSYGTTTTTTQFALTSGLVLDRGRWSLRASLPVYSQNGDELLTTGAGHVSRGEPVDAPGSGRGQGGGTGPGYSVETVANGYEAGIGDPLVHAALSLPLGTAAVVTTGASLKAPLVRSKFGTGEWDAGASLDGSIRAGRSLFGAGLAWWYVGDMPDFQFLNPLLASLSLGLVGRSGGLASIGLHGSTPPWSGADPALSVECSYSRRLGTGRSYVSAGLGFTNSAPDFTLGLGWRAGP